MTDLQDGGCYGYDNPGWQLWRNSTPGGVARRMRLVELDGDVIGEIALSPVANLPKVLPAIELL